MPSSEGSANGSSGDTLPANGSTLEKGSTGTCSVIGGVLTECHGDELGELVFDPAAVSLLTICVCLHCGRGRGSGAIVVSTTKLLEENGSIGATAGCCLVGTAVDTGTDTGIGAKGSTAGDTLLTGFDRERRGGGGGGTSSTK